MIEVFKTNVGDEQLALEVKELLCSRFPNSRINFDLHDCDNILRVEGGDFITSEVIAMVNKKGVVCIVLD